MACTCGRLFSEVCDECLRRGRWGRWGDPQTGISIRFIRSWRPSTPAEEARADARAWALAALLAVRERERALLAYDRSLTPAGRGVLEGLGISPE